MHSPLREHLEGYLSGALRPAQQSELETHVAGCSGCRSELAALEGSARELRALRAPADLDAGPAPGFFLRVMQSIEEQRQVPFWTLLVDPAFGRRLVFACLLVLAVLGGYVASAVDPIERQHAPETVLACAGPNCAPSPLPATRLGPNLNRNRSAVLVTLAANSD